MKTVEKANESLLMKEVKVDVMEDANVQGFIGGGICGAACSGAWCGLGCI